MQYSVSIIAHELKKYKFFVEILREFDKDRYHLIAITTKKLYNKDILCKSTICTICHRKIRQKTNEE